MSRFQARVDRDRAAREHHRHHDYQPQPIRITAAATPGDQDRARNIPIIGPISGGGAIPGSRPDHHRIGARIWRR